MPYSDFAAKKIEILAPTRSAHNFRAPVASARTAPRTAIDACCDMQRHADTNDAAVGAVGGVRHWVIWRADLSGVGARLAQREERPIASGKRRTAWPSSCRALWRSPRGDGRPPTRHRRRVLSTNVHPRRPQERTTTSSARSLRSSHTHVPRVLNGQLRCSSGNNDGNARRRSARLASHLRRTIDCDAKSNKRGVESNSATTTTTTMKVKMCSSEKHRDKRHDRNGFVITLTATSYAFRAELMTDDELVAARAAPHKPRDDDDKKRRIVERVSVSRAE